MNGPRQSELRGLSVSQVYLSFLHVCSTQLRIYNRGPPSTHVGQHSRLRDGPPTTSLPLLLLCFYKVVTDPSLETQGPRRCNSHRHHLSPEVASSAVTLAEGIPGTGVHRILSSWVPPWTLDISTQGPTPFSTCTNGSSNSYSKSKIKKKKERGRRKGGVEILAYSLWSLFLFKKIFISVIWLCQV